MNKTRTVIRFLLALVLAVFGADKFLHFMPQPDAPPEGGAFLGSLVDAGYVFPVIGLVLLWRITRPDMGYFRWSLRNPHGIAIVAVDLFAVSLSVYIGWSRIIQLFD